MPARSLPVKTAVLAVCGALLVGACSSDAEVGGSSSTTPDAVEPSAPVTSPSASGSSGSPDAQESSGSPTPSESDSADASPSNESSPPHSPRPSKSSSEVPAPPPMPAAAKENTAEGAEAFARWYVETLNHLYQHPKAGVLDKYAGDDCSRCQRFADVVAGFERDGQSTPGAPFKDAGSTSLRVRANTYEATVAIEQQAMTIRGTNGDVVQTMKADADTGLLFNLRFDRGWVISDLLANPGARDYVDQP